MPSAATKKPPAPKPAAAKPAAAKPAADDTAVASVTLDDVTKPTAPATLRLKDLVDRVSATTGGKKKGVKDIVEATLTQMGLALQAGEMLNLPKFGKVRIAKTQGTGPGAAMTLKLRPTGPGSARKTTDEALADRDDQG